MRRLNYLALMGALFACVACTAQQPPPHPSPPHHNKASLPAISPRCGRLTRLTPYPTPSFNPGAKIGPLWMFGFGKRITARVPLSPGYPTKILLHTRGPLDAPISVFGWRCNDHRALRSWYRGGLPFSNLAVSERALETTGEKTTVLRPYGHAVDYTGYMLFSAPGKWKVVFAQRSELLGSVTLEVGPELLGVVGCPHRQSRSRRWHDGLVEVKGTAKGGQLWALLEQPSSDRAEKIVWRMTGSGELSLVAVNTSGGWVLPDQLSLHSLGSTWDRPGSEWGSVFTFHRPGCWDVHAQRGSLVGDVWLSVR